MFKKEVASVCPITFQILESQLKMKEQQVVELDGQASHLKQLDPGKEEIIEAKKARVNERYL